VAPNEWNNLADDPKHAALIRDFRHRTPGAAKRPSTNGSNVEKR